MQSVVLAGRETGIAGDLSAYCDALFAPLARTEQRRWGEVYLRGLVELPGRKTLARISEHVLGERTVHPLHQFLSKSTWDVGHVRRSLAQRAAEVLGPRAWAVDEVVFPKYGDRSVGVARQYVPALGRTANCQIALVVSLLGERGSAMVNWRLMLPPHWDDERVRRGARVPDEERHRPRWQYILDAADEMAEEWELDPAPLVVDLSHENCVDELLAAFDGRGLDYLARIAPGTEVAGPGRRPRPEAALSGRAGRPVTAAELIGIAERRTSRSPQTWYDPARGRTRRSEFLTSPASGHSCPPQAPDVQRITSMRHVVAEWPSGRAAPTDYWLTNLGPRRLPQLVVAAKLHGRSRAALADQLGYGLGDFEGRSYVGWHHHVTLVGAAHFYSTLVQERAAVATAAR